MEKRECSIITALAVVIVILLGVLVGAAYYFTLYRPLQAQHAQLTEIQAELGGIETVHAQLTEIQAELGGIETVHAQLTEIQAELREIGTVSRFPRGQTMPPLWHSTDAAAPDSVEGQLRSHGKHWVRTGGEITVGAYVQDIYEGRMNQPQGRGAIGKVLAVNIGEDSVAAAFVDFGRGYVAGIKLSELSLVNVVPKDQ